KIAAAPLAARILPVTVWTGKDMLIFGGAGTSVNYSDSAGLRLRPSHKEMVDAASLTPRACRAELDARRMDRPVSGRWWGRQPNRPPEGRRRIRSRDQQLDAPPRC